MFLFFFGGGKEEELKNSSYLFYFSYINIIIHIMVALVDGDGAGLPLAAGFQLSFSPGNHYI